ncbi:MAG: type pilus assembly protein PilC [Actinomycetota bacterium]
MATNLALSDVVGYESCVIPGEPTLTEPDPAPEQRSRRLSRGKAWRQRSEATSDDGPVRWYQRDFHVGRVISLETIMTFSQQMSSFIEAGIPIVEALDIAKEETSSEPMKTVIDNIRDSIERGSSFTDAVAAQGSVFPAFYRAMLRSADYTGNLDVVLNQAAGYLERDISARAQVKSALTYPLVVVFVAFIAIIAMSIFVLPRFSTLYRSVGAKLPLPTRMLLGITDFFTSFWWLILFGLIAIGALGYLTIGGNRRKAQRDALIQRLPVFGPLVKLISVERFCRMLAALTHAGVPIPEGIGVAADSTNNTVFAGKIDDVREALLRGASLSDPLRETGLFPNTAQQMINIGERTGALSVQLSKAANYYEREVSGRIKRATDLFEPLVILVIGLVVGFVAVAQVSAMYSVFSQIR